MKPIRQTWHTISLPFITLAIVLSACGPQPTATPRPTATPAPANDDLARVKAAGKLRVGTSGDYAPFAFYTQNFQLDGLDIALMRELARRIGVPQVEFQDFAFDGVLDALRLKQVDVAVAALTVTDQRMQTVDFTNYYYVGADGVVARADSNVPQITSAQGLIGRKVGVQRGSVYETWLKQTLVDTNQLPAANLFTYANSDDAMRDLRDRRIDVVILDLIPAQRQTAPGSQYKLVGQQLNTQRIAAAVRKGSTLRTALDQALLSAQNDGTVNRLITQYLNVPSADIPQVLPTQNPGIIVVTNPPPAACVDGMSFIADLNYNDQNMTNPPSINPGQPFVKGWRVRNSGTCAWTTAFRFDYAGGNTAAALMNGQPQALGRVVNPGEVVDFQVSFVAPVTAGTYQGFWQMRNALGRNFGTRVWVGLLVPGFAPPTAQPGGDVLFSADRTQISPGERVIFNWQVRNAQSVTFYAEGDLNAQRSAVQFNGTAQVFPQASTTYSLRVTRFNGTIEIRQIAVQVAQSPNAPVILRFSLAPDGQVNLGTCVTISWQTSGTVNRVRLLRNNSPLWDGAPITGSTQDCPQVAGQNTYTLEAYGPTASTRAQRVLNVLSSGGGGGSPTINTFFVQPDQIAAGGCVTITWDTTDAIQVRVTRNGALRLDSGQLDGSAVDCLTQSGFYGYRLEAYGSSGTSIVRERAVTVFRTDTSRSVTPQP